VSTISNAHDPAFRKWAEKRGFRMRELVFGTDCRACTGFVSCLAVLSPEHTEANEVLCWGCTRSWHDSRPPQGWEMPFFEWLARRNDRMRPKAEAARRRVGLYCLAIEAMLPTVPVLWEPELKVSKLFAGGRE